MCGPPVIGLLVLIPSESLEPSHVNSSFLMKRTDYTWVATSIPMDGQKSEVFELFNPHHAPAGKGVLDAAPGIA